MDEREQKSQEEVKLPEERVEDLEPAEGDSDEVKGGAWPSKIEYGGLKAD